MTLPLDDKIKLMLPEERRAVQREYNEYSCHWHLTKPDKQLEDCQINCDGYKPLCYIRVNLKDLFQVKEEYEHLDGLA